MLKNLAIIAALALAPIALNAQATLGSAVQTAVRNNNGIKSYQKALESKQEAVSSSWGRFAPTITLDASYTHLDDKLSIDLAPLRTAIIQLQVSDQVNMANLKSLTLTGQPLSAEAIAVAQQQAFGQLDAALPPFVATLKKQNFPAASITVKQPIFTGGKILAGVDAAKAQRDMAEVKLASESETIISDVVSYYLSVLLAEENVKVRTDIYNGVKKHQELAEKSLLQGLIAQNDKLRADVAMSEAERNLNEANEKLQIAKSALASVLDINESEMQNPTETLAYHESNIDLKSFIDEAKSNNCNIKQLSSAVKALNAKADAQCADYYPTIYGFGKYNAFQDYLSALDPKWAVGIGLQYELFNGFRRTNDYQAAKADAQSVEYMAKDAERKIELLCRTQYMSMNLAKDMFLKLETTAEQAKENVRLNSRRFETGLGTSLEALDAELTLEGVLLKRVAALSEYYKYMSALYNTAGKTEEFVKFWTDSNQ